MDIYGILFLSGYFILIDLLWVTKLAKKPYAKQIGDMLQISTGTPLYIGLIGVYTLMLSGLYLFVLTPESSLALAALFGAIIYGVFGFTNHLVLRNWSFFLVTIDLLWGGFLYASTYFIAAAIQYI